MKKLFTYFLALALTMAASAQTSGIPNFISYQGRVETADGPVGIGTPVNRSVIFRIWDHPTNRLETNLLYSEQQTVTIFEGEFSVLVGQGGQTSVSPFGFDESTKKLDQLSDAFAGPSRYLGVTVDDGTNAPDSEISPRQQIASGGFAMRSKVAEKLESSTLFVTDEGTVGIGIPQPTRGKLEVVGFLQPKLPFHHSFDGDGGLWTNPNPTGESITNTSIYADNSIVGSHIRAFSDSRIKVVEGHSDSLVDLRTLCDIQVTNYRYKDFLKYGKTPSKKVIAQQVEKVFPQAVSRSRDVIPDIFEKSEIVNGWVFLETDLKKGERVQLIDGNTQGVYEVMEVKQGAFGTSYTTGVEEVFVYGREVNDFRVVDYEAIAMLNVSATQQIHKEVEALQAENRALRERLIQQEARNAARESRLIRLEEALLETASDGE